MRTILLALLMSCCLLPAAFAKDGGCPKGDCGQCHTMSVEEASAALGNLVDRVNNVSLSEISGLWVLEVEKDRQKFPVFMDISKNYLFSGNVIRLSDTANVTQQLHAQMNRIDVSQIPVDDALLLGNAAAKTKVILFTDPQCPFCSKMHESLKEVVTRDPQIAFLIKLFPLKMHPQAYDISKSIICSDSMEFLEKSLKGEAIPPAICETKVVDETLALVSKLGIRSTPTLVLPNGEVQPGYKKADDLLRLLGSSK